MGRAEVAETLMKEHRMNCAQIVLSVFCDEFDLKRITALKLAAGFGGGMGRNGRICGAVSGAYMALGLYQPLSEDNPRASLDKVYSLVKEFNRQFMAKHSAINCVDLLKCDLGTPEGLAKARENNLFTTICPVYVYDAVAIVESLVM